MSANAPVATVASDGKDMALADAGKRRIEWAFQSMPVLRSIRKQFIKTQPFASLRIAVSLPVTSESANLIIVLRDSGAEPFVYAPQASSAQEDVAASLTRDYHVPISATLDIDPQFVIDSGGTLIRQSTNILGATEEKADLRGITVPCPVISTHISDGRYGTGQTTLDGILRATNILLAGATVVISGYGSAGRDIAARARGLGANVVVTEVDPVRALEAAMDGYRVNTIAEACPIGDVFITVTGNKNVIGRDHVEKLKSGAVLCNAGQSGMEIDIGALGRNASSRREYRESLDEYTMRDGRRIFHVTAACAQSASVLDLSYSIQALSAEYLLKHRESLEAKTYRVPAAIEKQVARFKLEAMGVHLDRLTTEQEEYLAAWSETGGLDTVK